MIELGELTKGQGWLQSLRPLPTDVLGELRHRFEVSLTYHSTAIEGNTLSRSETQMVIEKGITIGGKSVREHLEVIGHKEALDFVLELADAQTEVSERTIREIHSLVMTGQGHGDHGGYRTFNVNAAGTEYVYPSHLTVQELMAEFADWLGSPSEMHPVDFASEAHLRFVTIHPFRDGNGRVGRLLMNLLLIRAGYPISVLSVRQRAEYIHALEIAQSSGSRQALDALIRAAVIHALHETLETALSSTALVVPDDLKSEIAEWLDLAGGSAN